MHGFKGRFEYSGAFSYNLKTKKTQQMLKQTSGLYPAQSGLGNYIGKIDDTDKVLMPAFMGSPGHDPRFHLLKVDLNTGKGRVHAKGAHDTIDWFAAPDGTVLAREDYNNSDDLYQIRVPKGASWPVIYEIEASRVPFSLLGIKADGSALIIVDRASGGEGFSAVYEMDFEGNVSAPVLDRADADIDFIFKTANRYVQGVKYSGVKPSYSFYDPVVDAAVTAMVDQFSDSAVHVTSWNDDWSQILYTVYGSAMPGNYVLQDVATGEVSQITRQRSIPSEAIGPILAIEYPARDGLGIEAILTLPAGIDAADATNLPLIVMPHGGPESYDRITFDWMAQYFANRGYMVLQPNFRGSAGYGAEFVRAGYGEWGGKMQDDVTDGVKALIKDGFVDGDRVCIAGASYGGYSALAGGAFTPEMYKCVIAIAPVSDLPKMLRDVKRERGARHWAVDYWQSFIGDPKSDKEKLGRISPVNSAEAFTAPVLLIHGKDDTVVPISQSRVMSRALKKAGKDVKLVELRGEDHWLSDGDTRLATLKAMDTFIETHIGQ